MTHISSPMPWGNGACVIHKTLEQHINAYQVLPYDPRLTFFPPLLKLLCRQCKAPRLIHTSPDYAFFFQKKGIPSVVTFHNYVLDRTMRPYGTALQKIHYATDLKWWTRLGVHYADQVTAVSKFIAGLIQKDLNIDTPVKIIYNGVDENKFIPAKTTEKQNHRIRVFFSGNLTRRKGVQWLSQIAEKLNSNIGIYYTQGLRKKGMIAPAHNIFPMGAVQYEDMPARYSQMDILLMPTVREGFGLAVAEAMACGLPIVATDCSAIPELVHDAKGGYLCPLGDVDAFAEKINILADSPGLRKEMGEYNRAKIEQMFTLDRMVKEYIVLFEQVMDQGASRGNY